MIDTHNLNEEDKQHIAEQINIGCHEGELVGDCWGGWWKLSFEKWDNSQD